MAIITTNLTCIERTGSGSLLVIPKAPLWISELILISHPDVLTATGTVTPGTPSNPVLRTIYVRPGHPALTAPTPFVLPVKYHNDTFVVVDLLNPKKPVLPDLLFEGIADQLAELDDEGQAEFIVRVLQLFASLPQSELLAIGESPELSKAAKKKSADNGKDEASPLS